LENSIGVPINLNQAFTNYKQAADCFDDKAFCFKIGYFYKEGLENIVQNNRKAFCYFFKSAELGDEVGMCHFARCYKKGLGTTPNLLKAFEWYLNSAEMHDLDGVRN
ncbi:8102_t:CDS:1, partial [Cetraspora pellucida]